MALLKEQQCVWETTQTKITEERERKYKISEKIQEYTLKTWIKIQHLNFINQEDRFE